ncbi:MAG: acyltransferase family protein [Bacilli bacterium]|nr:acyltransferase family protein [Bacilli bacterium]
MKKEFTKDDTLFIKGIAIIMMLLHHLFRNQSLFSNYQVSFFPLTLNFVMELTTIFKICVSIFAFLTGYGLYKAIIKEKIDDHKSIKNWYINRVFKTLSGFWIIAIIAFIVCQIIDGETFNFYFKGDILYGIIRMIVELLGMGKLIFNAVFSGPWWYMSIAVLFILSAPIFVRLFNKYGYTKVLLIVIFLPRVIGWNFVDNSYIAFLFPFLLGIIFSKENIIIKLSNYVIIKKNKYLNLITKLIIETLIIILLYRISVVVDAKFLWELKYGIFPALLICYLFEFFSSIPLIKNVLRFLGKHSMNIFLIHWIVAQKYLREYIYSYKNFLKIFLALLIISLVISIAIELLKKLICYEKLINKFKNKIQKLSDSVIN